MFMQRRTLPLLGMAGRGAPDPNYANVSLLVHMDGANGSTTFTDQKGNFTITANGNAQVSTSNPKFGSGAFISDGTGDYLQTNSLSASGPLDLSSGSFTIECWIYRASTGNCGICSWGNSFPGDYGGEFYISSSKLTFNKNGTIGIHVGSNSIPTSAWTHIAITYDGSDYRTFIDGTLDATTASASTPDFKTSGFFFAGNSVEGVLPNGSMIDEFRVTKGVARYTASFTAPTEAFPNR